jgi:acyl dehydratase
MTEARDLSFAMLETGMCSTLEWTVDDAMIDAFAALSGDQNPLHVDRAYAREHGFDDRVAHGFLLGAKVSAFIGMIIPGKRCLLVEETIAFPNPVFPGDRVTLTGEIAELWPDQQLLKLKLKASKASPEGGTTTVARGSVLCRVQS